MQYVPKIHFLESHLDSFPENSGTVSDEYGERFYKDISNMKKGYQGKCTQVCWLTTARPSRELNRQNTAGNQPKSHLDNYSCQDLV
jgi:hypothetical protein